MPMFGGKHFSNPKVGMAHNPGEGMGTNMGEGQEPPAEKAKSYSVHHHEDGTAHSHIHHADDTHEHTDHASAEEAHAHVAKAQGDGEEQGESMADDEESEAPMQKLTSSKVRHADSGAF